MRARRDAGNDTVDEATRINTETAAITRDNWTHGNDSSRHGQKQPERLAPDVLKALVVPINNSAADFSLFDSFSKVFQVGSVAFR